MFGTRVKTQESQDEDRLMEERKKKRQDEKKEAAQKKAAEQKTKVPESAKPGPSPLLPSSPCPVGGGGNGKRAPSSALQQQPTAARHPPREVPPRFRQHEHKQLLKRGQPLPAGTQPLAPAAGRPHAELPHLSGPGAQYENPQWGKSSTNRSAANSSGSWDRVIIDESDAEAWPSISRGDERSPAGCATDTERTPGKNRSMSMAAEGSQQAHYPAHHSGSKAGGSHLGTMVASQGGASRGWGSGPAPCPSAIGGEVKSDTLPVGGRGQPCWGSSSSNLNLNPNANPSAWPVLGHEGPGMGGGLGGNNPPPPNLCSPSGAPPAHGSSVGCGNMGSINGNPAGSGGTSAWGGMMPSEASEPRPSPSTNVSFSGQPQNLNTDGPNHTKPEPVSPIHGLPSWGNASVGMGSLVQPHQGALQVNGEGSSVWGIDDAKDPKDPGWGCGGNGGGWGQVAGGDWGRRSGEAKGWEAMGSPPLEQLGSWPHAANNPASEGSSDSQEGHPRRTERPPLEEAAPPLPAPDLDPRVLCNTGWGQTPVRQHTAWEIEEASRARRKNDAGTEAWGSSPNPAASMAGGANPNPTAFQKPDSDGKNEGPVPSKSSGWVDPAVGKKASNGPSGWGGAPPGPSANASKSVQSWAPEEKSPTWDDPNAKPKPQNWVEGPKATNSWGNGGKAAVGDWAEPGEGKKNRDAGDGGTWKENPRGWGRTGMGPGSGGGWGEPQPSGPSQGWGGKAQEGTNGNGEGGSVGSWGGPNTVKQSSSGWGMGPGGNGGAAKPEPAREPTGWEEPSPPSIRRKMEIDDGTSAWGDPSAYNKTVNLWDKNNPGAQGPSAASHGGGGGNGNHSHHHHSHHNQPSAPGHGNCNSASPDMPAPHQPGAPRNRPPLVAPGWGDLPSVHSKTEPSWGEPASPSPMVDNGTSAWGKPPGGCGGWGGGPEPSEPFSRGNPPTGPAPCNPAPKSMQDGWGGAGDDLSLSAAQWEPEDGDVWNSTTSQESNSSCNSWGNPPKKGPQKGKAPSKQDDAWIMGRLVKQLTDMGFPRDPAEEALKSNNMNLDQAMSTLLEKKTELDKRGMGISDYNNGLVNKQMGCRPPVLSKESSSDRPPFLDKDGSLVEDAQTSPFMPSPSLRLPLSSSALPGQALGGMSTGLAMQNLNSRQQMQSGMFGGAAQARAMQQQQQQQQQAPPPQPSVPSLSSSQPSLRAQVPQFLSPQVQAQLLQFAAKNIGLNPALLTSPINPQHMTLLNQLYQLQLAYQRLQIQQQMIQAQRGVSGPIRQQEQQVARTINNMQQQIQQHQRQLAQALLMKQNPTSHHNAGKSALDSFSPHLQTKEPQSSPNSYSPYPLSGLNHNMNVNSMDVGGLSMKESPQPQSRLSQWTHPNAMESLSGNSSPLEPSLGKHGASLGPPGKPSLDDSYSPYNLITGSESPSSPLVPPDSWGPSKSGSDKISNGTSISWPPEFCPGVPWKGLQNIDPETDPNVTPGSVPSGPTINTNIQDVNRYLLRDRSGGSSPTAAQNGAVPPSSDWPVSSFTSSFGLSSPDADDAGKISDKSAWSPGPISHTQASLSHELWKGSLGPRNATAPTRPPPGLTNTKPSSTWGGGTLGLAPGWSSSYSPGSTWSTDSSTRTSWLVLRNLTPQIDGSTLRTLCLQHGPLITFHLSLTQGNAVVRYSSKEEAAKAQKSLHMCVLGNTTILAEFAGEEEVNRFFAQGQSLPPTTCWQANPGTNQTRLGGAAGAAASHAMGHWNSGGLSGTKAGGDLLWGGVPQYSSLWGPPGGEDARVIGSPTPINTLLPGDLLSGESL